VFSHNCGWCAFYQPFRPGSRRSAYAKTMMSSARFAIAVFAVFAPVFVLAQAVVPLRAEDTEHPAAAAVQHACLNQKERRAEAETGKLVRLAAAMRTARGRMPGTVVRARLCHGQDGLVYVLTVLARDGRVAQITVDAVKGSLVGGL
jgi:uncharacterized membrane protein YkoI